MLNQMDNNHSFTRTRQCHSCFSFFSSPQKQKQKFGLRLQDLQEEKDKLVVETADMLRCNLLTAEILLKKHGKPVFEK